MLIELKKSIAKEAEPDKYIDYTKKIVAALKNRVSEHNDSSTSLVRLEQLVDVFAAGENNCADGKKLHECCWARVEMFCGLMNGINSYKEFAKAKKLCLINRQFIDMSASWEPTEAHYLQAKANIQRFGLEFEFDSISQLYFYKKKQLTLVENYL